MLIASAPFKRVQVGQDHEAEWNKHKALMSEKWAFYGSRFEAILLNNNPQLVDETAGKNAKNGKKGKAKSKAELEKEAKEKADAKYYLVGTGLTYADVLVTHVMTWFLPSCCSSI